MNFFPHRLFQSIFVKGILSFLQATDPALPKFTLRNARSMTKFAKDTAAYEARVSAAEKKEKGIMVAISRAIEKLTKTKSSTKGVYVQPKKIAHYRP